MKTLFYSVVAALTLSSFVSCKCLKKTDATMNETEKMNTKPAPFTLEGTKWELISLDKQNRKFSPSEETSKIELSFANGAMSYNDGCNSHSSNFSQDKYKLSFEVGRSTRRYCDEDYMKMHGYSLPITQIKTFFVENDILKFYNETGELLATYKKAN